MFHITRADYLNIFFSVRSNSHYFTFAPRKNMYKLFKEGDNYVYKFVELTSQSVVNEDKLDPLILHSSVGHTSLLVHNNIIKKLSQKHYP